MAKRTSVIRGILWHQGEGDCREELYVTYESRFKEFMEALRTELDLHHVPFLLGGLGDFLKDCPLSENLKNYTYVNAALEKIARESLMTGFVSAKGLTANSDNLHFNSKALYEFGLRYYNEFEKIKSKDEIISEVYHEDNIHRTEMELL